MRAIHLIAIVTLWLDIGLAVPLGLSETVSLHERDPRLGLGGSIGKIDPRPAPKPAPKAAPKPAAPKPAPPKASPPKATPPKATPSRAAPPKSAPPKSTHTSVAGVKTSSHISSPTSSLRSTSADPLATSAWPQPTIAGASPPSLAAAKAAKAPAFPKVAPPNSSNSSALYTPEFDEEAGVPTDLQKRSPPLNGNKKKPVPPGIECPDTTDDMLRFGFMQPVPAGQAMFYTGVDVSTLRTKGAVTPSKKFADAHNLKLLKDFVTAHAVSSNVLIEGNCPTFWTLASQYLAEQVQGNVLVLMNPLDTARDTDPRAWPFLGSTTTAAWRKPEWPTLQKNTKVCSVWRFDVTGKSVLLFKRPGCDAQKPF